MATVNTVTGPLDTADLGYTLVHEHVLSTSAGMKEVYPEFIDRQGTIETAVSHLKECYGEGLRTLMDMAPFDLGRDVRLLEEVSQKSGVRIIATTGTWLTPPREFATSTPDMIAPLYVRETQEGIEGTGIKAGIIKAATDRGGVTDVGEILLRAVARAHQQTGVPISTHTYSPGRVGEEQVRIFKEEGVDLNRVCIGHSNDTTDMDYLTGLLEQGVWLGLDHFPGGSADTPDWEERTQVVKQLIDRGYGDRLMLSHDFNLRQHRANEEERKARWERNPDGYLFIKRRVLPRLLELGVAEDAVRKLNEDNVRRFFEGS